MLQPIKEELPRSSVTENTVSVSKNPTSDMRQMYQCREVCAKSLENAVHLNNEFQNTQLSSTTDSDKNIRMDRKIEMCTADNKDEKKEDCGAKQKTVRCISDKSKFEYSTNFDKAQIDKNSLRTSCLKKRSIDIDDVVLENMKNATSFDERNKKDQQNEYNQGKSINPDGKLESHASIKKRLRFKVSDQEITKKNKEALFFKQESESVHKTTKNVNKRDMDERIEANNQVEIDKFNSNVLTLEKKIKLFNNKPDLQDSDRKQCVLEVDQYKQKLYQIIKLTSENVKIDNERKAHVKGRTDKKNRELKENLDNSVAKLYNCAQLMSVSLRTDFCTLCKKSNEKLKLPLLISNDLLMNQCAFELLVQTVVRRETHLRNSQYKNASSWKYRTFDSLDRSKSKSDAEIHRIQKSIDRSNIGIISSIISASIFCKRQKKEITESIIKCRRSYFESIKLLTINNTDDVNFFVNPKCDNNFEFVLFRFKLLHVLVGVEKWGIATMLMDEFDEYLKVDSLDWGKNLSFNDAQQKKDQQHEDVIDQQHKDEAYFLCDLWQKTIKDSPELWHETLRNSLGYIHPYPLEEYIKIGFDAINAIINYDIKDFENKALYAKTLEDIHKIKDKVDSVVKWKFTIKTIFLNLENDSFFEETDKELDFIRSRLDLLQKEYVEQKEKVDIDMDKILSDEQDEKNRKCLLDQNSAQKDKKNQSLNEPSQSDLVHGVSTLEEAKGLVCSLPIATVDQSNKTELPSADINCSHNSSGLVSGISGEFNSVCDELLSDDEMKCEWFQVTKGHCIRTDKVLLETINNLVEKSDSNNVPCNLTIAELERLVIILKGNGHKESHSNFTLAYVNLVIIFDTMKRHVVNCEARLDVVAPYLDIINKNKLPPLTYADKFRQSVYEFNKLFKSTQSEIETISKQFTLMYALELDPKYCAVRTCLSEQVISSMDSFCCRLEKASCKIIDGYKKRLDILRNHISIVTTGKKSRQGDEAINELKENTETLKKQKEDFKLYYNKIKNNQSDCSTVK